MLRHQRPGDWWEEKERRSVEGVEGGEDKKRRPVGEEEAVRKTVVGNRRKER